MADTATAKLPAPTAISPARRRDALLTLSFVNILGV